MIDVQKRLFGRLAELVRSSGNEYRAAAPLNAKRWVSGDADDKEALQRVHVLHSERVPGLGMLALSKWRNRYIFSLPTILSGLPEGSNEVDVQLVNAGLTCLLFAQDETDLVVPDVLMPVNEIFGAVGEYPITSVEKFFVRCNHYWTKDFVDALPTSEALSRCQAVCARSLVERSADRWNRSYVPLFDHACSSGAERVVGASLLSAAVASTWQHRFLEVYRAIEALFVVMCVEDLIQKLPSGASGAPREDLVDALSETLQWRLRQDTTLARLIGRLPESRITRIAYLLGVNSDRVAHALYDVRNRVAHGALVHKKIDRPDEILEAGLLLLAEAYVNISVPAIWLTAAPP